MDRFGVRLLFITFLEIILTVLSIEFMLKSPVGVIYNIPVIVSIILIIELILSIYFIYKENNIRYIRY